ncbi:MAG: hypothetical protein JJT89_03965 [Nitriliruptoraceae bacterium]|nr:hypothetical protein [Nitriliruptoraceae bacterium]
MDDAPAGPPIEPGGLRWTSLAEEPSLVAAARAIERDVPGFLAELTASMRARLDVQAASSSFVVTADRLPVAVVRAVPWSWSGQLGTAPVGGLGQVAAETADVEDPDTLAVLDVTVAFGARGRGVGRAVLDAVGAEARQMGAERWLVLLRPHAKRDFPLVPFERYLSFVREDGLPFDPWLRTAWRAGLVPAGAASRSLVGRAPLEAWERWMGTPIPGSGPYLVGGAIKPAILETERDEGRYREPHLWVAGGAGVPSAPGWVDALAAAGIVAGDRRHREVKRRS